MISESRLLPVPMKTGISPRKRESLLRRRYETFEHLCSTGGEGLPIDMGPSKYLEIVVSSYPELTRDKYPDLWAVFLDWLGSPLSPPWHYHICDAKSRLFFVNDSFLTAHSDHPDLSAMRRLCRYAKSLENVLLADDEASRAADEAADWKDWADTAAVKGLASDIVKMEICNQKAKFVTYLHQYVARLGVLTAKKS